MLVPLTDSTNPYAVMMLELIRSHWAKPATPPKARKSAPVTPVHGPRGQLDRAA